MQGSRKDRNIMLEKDDGKKTEIAEVELNSDEGLTFFDACHRSNGSKFQVIFC